MNNVCFDEGGFRIPKRHPEEAKRRKLEEVSEAKAQYKALGLTRREAFEQGLAGPPRGSKARPTPAPALSHSQELTLPISKSHICQSYVKVIHDLPSE